MDENRKEELTEQTTPASPVQGSTIPFDEIISEGVKDADRNPTGLTESMIEVRRKKDLRNTAIAGLVIFLIAAAIVIVGNLLHKTPEAILSSCWQVNNSQALEVKCSSNVATHKVEKVVTDKKDCPNGNNFAVMDATPGQVLCLHPLVEQTS